MVTLIGPLSFHEEINIKHLFDSRRSINKNNNKYPRHSLKHKHSHKHRCKRIYKYKLRQNGEDSDVIDVSQVLLSTLRIRSPRKQLKSPEKFLAADEVRPKNYLFKMARRKQKAKAEANEVVKNDNDTESSPSTETQTKKQTNAFQILMDSRNKSIGANSPGKEKSIDETEVQEIIEKKNLKVKRNLALQKMAEAKGSLKRKEMEEYQDKCIERQMKKRAERLKSMIKPKDSKASKVTKKSLNNEEEVVEIEDNSNSNDSKSNTKKIKHNKCKTLQLVDMFMKPDNTSPDKKKIPKEDQEFLSKLSPSIRKKENMLCYFKKIDKKSPPSIEAEEASNESPVIKVKVSLKNKKKLKKKRLSLNKQLTIEVLKDLTENNSEINDAETQIEISETPESQDVQEKNSHERTKVSVSVKSKRKENLKVLAEEADEDEPSNSVETNIEDIRRPKRNVKRPAKYVDDAQLFSSDEDLHIFTPRKKKKGDEKISNCKEKSEEIVISDNESKKKVTLKIKKNVDKEDKVQKKPAKLAPIFAPKPQLNPEQLEAKQRFLYSGVPEQIKKIISQQKINNTEVTNDFPVVVHVQQIETVTIDTKMCSVTPDHNAEDDVVNDNYDHIFSKLMSAELENNINNISCPKNNATAVLQNIKEQYPKFPVHRIYRLLKTKSKGEFKEGVTAELDNSSEIINGIVNIVDENPEYLNWADKYKATSTKHLIGNFESIKELKRWLLSWTEIDQKLKNAKAKTSDSSDFYDSDSNSRDSFRNNLLIVTGPVGCGKTSSVYAVAAELAIKVIEVNASSKRTGKVMLQDLQEATQSHKVNRGGLENSQKSQEVVETVTTIVIKKRGRPKKSESTLKINKSKDEMLSQSQPTASQDSVRTVMSLILVDDADIVFDQDDGFSSAIAQLIQCSKRPVILVTSSVTCPHLQRFLQYGKVIYLHPLLPKMLGTWLDIMCLAEGICWQGLGAMILNYHKGDIRKSINCLQFYMTAYAQNALKETETSSQNHDFKQSPEEENSNMSWPDSEGIEDKISLDTTTKNTVWKKIMDKEANLLHLKYPKDLFNVWWNVPSLLHCQHEVVKPKHSKQSLVQELEAVADVIDYLSISDLYSISKPDTSCNITSKPWYSSETDSVSEQECMESFNKCHEVNSDILQDLVASSIVNAQKTLQCERNTFIQFPCMSAQREKDRVTFCHDNLTCILNPSAALDRKALAVDYWSTCRTICRVEKNKTDTVSKRNNRFCHYLKSLNVMCKNDCFDSLGDSLFVKGKED